MAQQGWDPRGPRRATTTEHGRQAGSPDPGRSQGRPTRVTPETSPESFTREQRRSFRYTNRPEPEAEPEPEKKKPRRRGPAPGSFFDFGRIKFRWFRIEGVDFNFVISLLFLLGFGLLMVYSASSYVAVRDFSDQTHFFRSQLRNDIIGLIFMVLVAYFPYRFWQKIRHVEYAMALLVVALVLVFGVESHGATRWVALGPIQFQPAEAAKLAIILYLAAIVDRYGKSIDEPMNFITFLLLPLPICAEIYLLTDNLSSAIIVYGIAGVMLFVATRGFKVFWILLIIGGAAAAGIVGYVANMTLTEESSFRLGRIVAWLHPENSTDRAAHQALQSMYAIGSGGIWGKGLGQSVQKLGSLPEPHNDFIFSIICEELGIVGATVLILLYLLLLGRMYAIARNTTDRYGFMVVVGTMAHIALQTVLNIAVATNSIPNTGVSLPFVSFGGSSAIFTLMEIGLVMSVHRYNVLEAKEERA